MEHASQRRLRRSLEVLMVVAGVLAGVCVVLALGWRAEHRVAECWRAAFEDDEHPPEGRCAR
jgi:hypothetical protein